jgi:hypothetical protein
VCSWQQMLSLLDVVLQATPPRHNGLISFGMFKMSIYYCNFGEKNSHSTEEDIVSR